MLCIRARLLNERHGFSRAVACAIGPGKEMVSEPEGKKQVPPLRCAPVGMTILLGQSTTIRLTGFEAISLQQNCHPDRSAAQWRDLLFPFRF